MKLRINKLFLIFLLLLVYWCFSTFFKKPIIDDRYFSCFNSNLPLDNLEILANSGCQYPWYTYPLFQLFRFLPIEYYHIGVFVFFFVSIFLINFFVIKRIALYFKINPSHLLLFSFLFWFIENDVSYLLSFTLINLSVLFFIKGSKNYFFLSGLLLALGTFRPHPLFLFLGLFLSFFVRMFKFKHKKIIFVFNFDHFYNSLYFLIGGFIIYFSFLFNSPEFFSAIYLASIYRVLDFGSINARVLFLLFVFIFSIFSKKKDNLTYAYLICFPLILPSVLLLGSSSRFFEMISLVPVILFLREKFKFKQVIVFSFIFLFFLSNLTYILIKFFYFVPISIVEKQLDFIDSNSRILTDLFRPEELLLRYNNTYLLADGWLYSNLVKNGFFSPNNLTYTLNNFIDANNINVIIISPASFESSLSIPLNFYNKSFHLVIPSTDHLCPNCRMYSTVYFNNNASLLSFVRKISYYWSNNYVSLCSSSPFVYKNARTILRNFVNLPVCNNNFDMIILLYSIAPVTDLIVSILTFVLFLILFLFNFVFY